MTEEAARDAHYLLGHEESEIARLAKQAELLRPFTERVLHLAGLQAGMRVLDIGCGSGDLALLLRQVVGDAGSVLGVDRERRVIERAQLRIPGAPNLRFETGTLETLAEADFDMVVGRFVLEYQQDQKSFLQQAAAHVRPGGLLVCIESSVWEDAQGGLDPEINHSIPVAPLFEEVYGYIRTAFRLSGAHYEVGARYVPLFHEAGLAEPVIHEEAVTGGADSLVIPWMHGLMQSVMPILEKHGITTAAGIGLDTLADRMTSEVRAQHSQMRFASLSGAWAQIRAA